MPEFKLTFSQNIKRTATTESFRFTTGSGIDFKPGQFLELIFDPADRTNRELNKYLSFSCAPAKGYLEVTKRLSSSSFSVRLKGLKPGDEILAKGPLGNCIFQDQYQKIAFLIGGIGITPVIAILENIVNRKLPTDAVLFYSNRTEEEIAFKKELDSWQELNSNIRVFYAVTDCKPQDNRCIWGRIDKELLSLELADIKERIVFIFGPPKMVEAMQQLCIELGCYRDKVKTENFLGY